MRPRVGHIVWFQDQTWEGGPIASFAAIVTRTVRPGVVDLTVFHPNAEPYRETDVPQDESGERAKTWRWPVDEPAPSPYR